MYTGTQERRNCLDDCDIQFNDPSCGRIIRSLHLQFVSNSNCTIQPFLIYVPGTPSLSISRIANWFHARCILLSMRWHRTAPVGAAVQITPYFTAQPVSDLRGRNKRHFAQHYAPNENFNSFVMIRSRLKHHEDSHMKVVTYQLVRNYWNVYVRLHNIRSIRPLCESVAVVFDIPRLNLGNGVTLALPSLVYRNLVLLDVLHGCHTWSLFHVSKAFPHCHKQHDFRKKVAFVF